MANPVRIEDMTAVELSALLRKDSSRLTATETTALGEFVDRIGGVKNAWLAVNMLFELGETA